eukprot:Skav211484  [mRNA]  locus=scaffold2188:226124:230616:- [translate_table: standard]
MGYARQSAAKKADQWSECVFPECGKLEGSPFSAVSPLVESLLFKCCKSLGFEVQGKAKPKGDVFPLPCSTDFLRETVGEMGDVAVLRCLCLALNSYAGVALEGPPKGSPLQCELIRGLAEDVNSVCKWTERFEDLTWQSFFRMRSVDYLGDEVATAKHTSWENLAPAIPSQVGTVELSQLLEGGCKHYVDCFEDYLLEEADRWYVRPPRVMIPDEHWEAVCEGLLKAGICTVLHEDQLFKVEDRPLLNGLFGVEKGEQVGGYDVHRLIMNLIPLNGICRGIQGDVATLPSWASAGPLQLMPTEQLLISSEDVRCFFYIFRVPTAWHKFLGFNKPVPQKFCGNKDGKHYLCATVLPMGFKNSVALAQAVHRSVVVKASSRLDGHLSGEQEIRKDKPFPRSTLMHRIYLDNFDELQKCDVAMASLVKGSPSPAVLALRAEYEHWGIPRHPGKAVERGEVAEVQGAVVDGVQGCAYPKPAKVLKYTQLALLCLKSRRCTQKQMQVIAGGLVYICTFRRAILGSMNYVWSFIESFTGYPPFIKLEIPALVKLEVARCIALMPLAKLQFRNKIDPLVTASDASTTGGGVTASLGLTNQGQVAASTKIRGDLPEPAQVTQVLTIGLFDGIGALRVAADSLQLPIAGHISVEKEASASRVLESRFPGTLFVTDVAEVDKAMVQSWACQFSQVGLIVIGAGPPCQGVSGLNANRRGALKDHRSCLFLRVSRIRLLVQEVFVWAQVHLLGESVQSMDQKDRTVMSESFELLPWAIDAADVSLAHRPRLYWISWELQPGEDVLIHPPTGSSPSEFGQVKLSCTIEAKRYLTPGWQKCSDTSFPTFTTARPRPTPGRRPAGLDKLNASEKAQWVADDFRFPPYQYQLCHQVYRGQEHRLPSSDEREVMMGLPKGYTYHCLPKSRQGTQEHTDLRNSLVGNSWNVTVVCWLLSQLAAPLGLCEALSPQQCVDITAPGCAQTLASFLGRPPMYSSKKHIKGGNEKQLVSMLVNQEGRASQMGKKVSQHLEAKSKADRKKVRATLGTLSSLTVQPRTRVRYDRALQRFFSYLAEHKLTLPKQRSLLDGIVSDYLESMWAEGEGRSLASDTLAALQDREPYLKGQLVHSWRLLKTWVAHELPNRAPPFTEEVVQTLVGYCNFHNNHVFALSLLLGFYGLLRTGELLSIRNKDIAQASSSSVAVISLGLTKTGQRSGASESVTITEQDTLRRLWQWKTQTAPGTSLCPAPHRWRKSFNQILEQLALDDLHYRPYSLRRGGATFYFQRHGQLDRLLVQGRWQSSRTARIYIDDGLAVLAASQVKLSSRARVFHQQFLRGLTRPLPQLEHTLKGRAGGTGKGSKKRSKPKGKDKKKNSKNGC